MENQSFTTAILVDQTPKQAFDAINNVRRWWSENIEGNTGVLNDAYIYHYKDIHYCKIKVVELASGKKVVWQVLDNYFKFTSDKSEWTGTTIVFDIAQQDGQTQVKFTHHGLVPQYECYDICNDAWTGFIHNSLRSLIVTGKGEPTTKEDDTFNVQILEKWKPAI